MWLVRFGGFHGHGGAPKWVVFVREHPIKMDDLGGTSISRNLHLSASGALDKLGRPGHDQSEFLKRGSDAHRKTV